MQKLVVASNNKGKLKEIKEILKGKYEVVSMGEMGFCEEIVEDGDSFYANAKIKAQTVARALNLDALADDSGLCVDALGGAGASLLSGLRIDKVQQFISLHVVTSSGLTAPVSEGCIRSRKGRPSILAHQPAVSAISRFGPTSPTHLPHLVSAA